MSLIHAMENTLELARKELGSLEHKCSFQETKISEQDQKINRLCEQLTEHGIAPAEKESNSSMITAIQAASVFQWGNLSDKTHYLMSRGWTMGSNQWWTNRAMGYEMLLFDKAMEVQTKADLEPFKFLIQDLHPVFA